MSADVPPPPPGLLVLAPTRFAGCSRRQAIALLALVLVVTGYAVFLTLTRDTRPPKIAYPPSDPLAGNDIELFRRMIARVRAGQDYYDAANIEYRQHGFKADSIFNVRLPTGTWVLSALPNAAAGQALLVLLALAAMVLTFMAERRQAGILGAVVTVTWLYGVFHFCLEPSGDAVVFQEMWAAVLLSLSFALLALGLRSPGVLAAVAALCFRELALPYLLVLTVLAGWHRRWREVALCLLGLAVFAALLGYHGVELWKRQDASRPAPVGVSEWIQFGGLLQDIIATRTNLWTLVAAGWMVALYLCLSVFGLAGWRGEDGARAALTVGAYLLAFAIVSRPYNTYWGLLFAPLLPFGLVRAPTALLDLVRAARRLR